MILLATLFALAAPPQTAEEAREQALHDTHEASCVHSAPPTDPADVARRDQLRAEAERAAEAEVDRQRQAAMAQLLEAYLALAPDQRSAHVRQVAADELDLLGVALQEQHDAAPSADLRQALHGVLHERHARFLVTATCMLQEAGPPPDPDAARAHASCVAEEARLRGAAEALQP